MANDLEHKKKLLRIKKRNLWELEVRAASYGPLEVPLELLRQIDELKEEIGSLEAEIARPEELPLSTEPLTGTTAKRPVADELEAGKGRRPTITRSRIAFLFLCAAALAAIWFLNSRQTTSNQAPVISGITASPSIITPGSTTTLTTAAIDPDEDALTFTWSAQKGDVPSGPRADSTITYRAPDIPGNDIVKVRVSDGRGGVTEASVTIRVVVGGIPTRDAR